MIYKNLDGILPAHGESAEDRELLALVRGITSVDMVEHFSRFGFSFAIDAWMRAVFACNAYVDAEAPWALRKTDPERMAAVLGTLVIAVRKLAEAIAPVIPTAAAKLLETIDAGADGTPIEQPVPLFPRLELLEDEEAAA
jgi:methionyl-tRNA synthetase